MSVYKGLITGIESHGGSPTYTAITDRVQKIIDESGIKSGLCCVIAPHTTCSVFTDETVHDVLPTGDEFLMADLNNIMDKIIPPQVAWGQYFYPGQLHFDSFWNWPDEEVEKWLPGRDKTKLWNCDAHLRATMIGASEMYEVEDGKLCISSNGMGHVYFVDWDRTRVRQRNCKVIIIGD